MYTNEAQKRSSYAERQRVRRGIITTNVKQKTQTTTIDGTTLTASRREKERGKMSKLNNRETNIK